ncbi:acyl-CoA dehydrogenase family protein [Vineibacter terrae]|uniref:acyl-CoA dehydrogenase family protein n=1 Tax=Vineibacter terrae TaxID=2586908 RepID=UPI002E30AEF9|nr:acyl-CoA dehydrogenase family protein [Vineibacter terrae]HEX2886124.1 acyl-CoA dehydrogenase family protein [Vineibacter terrae]
MPDASPDRLKETLWSAFVDEDYAARVRRHVASHVAPHAERIDRDDIYPVEIMKGLAKAGLSTVVLDRRYGGQGLGYAHAATVCEELSVASAAVGVSLITILQAQTMIGRFGRDSLKARYLPAFAEGLLSSYALTEAGHGSDIRQLDTKARRDGDDWVITGEKHFITSGSAAEFFVILAQTDIGVSVFAVPRDAKGLSIYKGPNSATFGLRNGPHMNVVFADVRVPLDHLIGEEGKGVRQAVTVLDYSRTMAAAISIGIARAAFEGALTFARDRVAFDQRVLQFQGIQWYFADMLSEIDAARLLIYRACTALDRHEQIARWSSEAKLKASAVATDVAARAVQVCGAYGVMENAPFGRYLRDAKAYEIAGGSSEVLKNTAAKFLLAAAGLATAPGARRA